ncbi:MAG: nucleoside hydrolase [Sphingomonadaceae bacterium]|nr:nucleoside hydrolase [Sphingomonadaceae bacterium]
MIAQTADPAHLIILDTDPGIDDAMTFAFLKSRRDVRLLAVTSVFGNADVATTTRNALYLLDRFGMDVPVHIGAATPLSIPRRPVASHVHGHDALGNTGLALNFVGKAHPEAAHDAIVRLVRANPHRVTILAIAPLTNLALALRAAPDIADLVSDVVVMGGAFGYGARRGNVSPVAEANAANDPHAADEVLGAAWPVTMVGLDVTSQCILPAQVAADLAERDDDARFLWDISRAYERLYRDHDGLDGGCIHDVAAAIRMVEPGLFRTVSGPVRVVTEGFAAGQTILRPEGIPFPPGAWDGLPSQKACIKVDSAALLKIYQAAFTPKADVGGALTASVIGASS